MNSVTLDVMAQNAKALIMLRAILAFKAFTTTTVGIHCWLARVNNMCAHMQTTQTLNYIKTTPV